MGERVRAKAFAIVGFLSAVGCGSTTQNGSPTGAGGAAQGGVAGAQAGAAGSSSGTAGASGGTGGGTGGSSAGAAGVPMTPDGVCRAVIEAQCEAKTRCGDYSDVTLCTQYAELCPDYYFSEGSTRSVDALMGCLDALRNASCWEVEALIYPACVSAGTLADGAPCTYSSQCASNSCTAATGTCKTCEHAPGPNEACTPYASSCVPGYFCNPSTSMCTPVPTAPAVGEGQPCNMTSSPFVPCQGMLTCGPTPASATPVCYALPGAGEACPDGICEPPLTCHGTGSSSYCSDFYGCMPPCAAGSRCLDSGGTPTCVPYASEGEPCGDTSAGACGPGLVCSSSQCWPRPGLGDPCVGTFGDCTQVLTCVSGECAVPEPVPCP